MKYNLSLLCFLLLSVYSHSLEIHIETPYAVLINAETGKILYEKNARTKIYPASTMKLATMLYVLEQKDDSLSEVVSVAPEALLRTSEQEKKAKNYEIPAHFLEPDGTMIYLRKREAISIESLIFASHLKSANDACNALAFHVGGDIPSFVEKLNGWTKELGLESTNFMNPHGLHHPQHYSCAIDMAMIGRAAYHNQNFMQMALQRSYIKPKTNLQNKETWKSNSCILREDDELSYSNVLFAKTGQMKAAKFNLVAAATNGERTLIAALHKSPNWKQRYLDIIHMFETAFQEEKVKRLLFAKEETQFENKLLKGAKNLIAIPSEDIFIEYFSSEEPKISATLEWNQELKLPVLKGDRIAQIVLSAATGEILSKAPLFAKETVRKKIVVTLRWAAIPFIVLLPLSFWAIRSRRKKSKD